MCMLNITQRVYCRILQALQQLPCCVFRILLIRNPAAKIVVLVPNVTLTKQHEREYIKAGFADAGFAVGGFSSENQMTPLKWLGILHNYSVIIATAQSLLNCMVEGPANFDQLLLLIIDEAHHAKKNSPFNQVMELYRAIPVQQRRTKVRCTLLHDLTATIERKLVSIVQLLQPNCTNH